MFTQDYPSQVVTDGFSSLHGLSFFVRQGPAAKSLSSWERERGWKKTKNCILDKLLAEDFAVFPAASRRGSPSFLSAFWLSVLSSIFEAEYRTNMKPMHGLVPSAGYGLSECETLDSDPDLPRSNLIIWHLPPKKISFVWEYLRDVKGCFTVCQLDDSTDWCHQDRIPPLSSKPTKFEETHEIQTEPRAGFSHMCGGKAGCSHLSRWLSCNLQTKFDGLMTQPPGQMNVTIGWFDDFCCFHLGPSKHLYKNPEMPTTTGPVGQPHGAPVVPNFQKLPANVKTEVETKWGHRYVVGPPSAPLFHLSKKTRGGSGIHEPCWRPHACHAAWRKVRISPYKFSWMTWNDTKGVQIVELFWTHHSHIGRQECVRQSNQPCLSCLWKGISMHIMHLLLEIHWPSKVEGYFANAAGLSLPRRFEAFSLPWSIQPKLTTLHLSLQTWLWDLKNLQNQVILLPFAFWKLRC